MRAMLCEEFGEPSVLTMGEIDEPVPGPGQVKVEVHSVGVNFPDLLLVAGKYQAKPARRDNRIDEGGDRRDGKEARIASVRVGPGTGEI